jgi:hypothetical protein
MPLPTFYEWLEQRVEEVPDIGNLALVIAKSGTAGVSLGGLRRVVQISPETLQELLKALVMSVAALTIATTAVPAGAICVLDRFLAIPRASFLEYLAALSFLRTIVSPPLATAFVVAGLVAPSRASRWALLAAAGIEGAVAVYAVFQWFVGCCWI